MRSKRKGFAIVLVAALAGLIFLLGASLVVVSRLQTSAAHYDQRVRLARENARLGLGLALAELQDKAGKDVAVSFAGDALSAGNNEDFKGTRTAAVLQPFWTGVSDGGSTSWLVTRRFSGSEMNPENAYSGSSVELLGAGTVGDNHNLKVSVPTESIEIEGVDGFGEDDGKTIGNYGYWVGDLGVKGSYAWYDQVDRVTHMPYQQDPDEGTEGDETFVSQYRLRQASIAKPDIGFVDTNDETVTPSNRKRIDLFASDFQFRERFGDSDENERYLVGLSADEMMDSFHDFTPLSKGLLVDSKRGGFRFDLSLGEASSAFDDYDYYTRIGSSDLSVEDGYDNQRFRLDELHPAFLPSLSPVITQFNLNFSVYLSAAAAGNQVLTISYTATVEIWNPFTSALEFEGGTLKLGIVGLPTVSILGNDGDLVVHDPVELSYVEFEVDHFSSSPMRAGEIVVLSGPQVYEDSDPRYTLGAGDVKAAVLLEANVFLTNEVTSLVLNFESSDEVTLGMQFSMLDADGNVVAVRPYGKSGYVLDNQAFTDATSTEPLFGFSWKLSDSILPFGQGYNPFVPNLSTAVLDGWVADTSDLSNTAPDFESGSLSLLGYDPSAGGGSSTEYDLPVVFLPKQELVNVGQLSGAIETSSSDGVLLLGNAETAGVANDNEFFDRYFFSSIPTDITGWSSANQIPNAFYAPKSGQTIPALSSSNGDAAEGLYVHGMFNVHSTSIDAWAALLKGSPVSEHPYWSEVFDDASYLFMNHPLGGEDINIVDPATSPEIGSLDATRASLKKNAFALTEAEVDTLAGLIVKEIRTYVKGSDGTPNPFDSLEEFVDSGVIQNAIDAMELDPLMEVNPSWVVSGMPAEFRQSTVLNLISGVLSVRSDTFLLRAYGDSVDPANPETTWAKAYCEAIVQRTHEQYDDVIDESNVASDKSAIDRTFEIVAFRWLSPSEI